jgi:3-isopropylmalate dehydrogenase
MYPSYPIAVLPGDGIGPEVMASTLQVLDALGPRIGRRFECQIHPAGAQHYVDTGDALPALTLQACRGAAATLFGAMGLPHVRAADGTEIIPQLDIRFALDLYAGVRPIRTWPGLPTPLRDERAQHIDLVLVRENTEGLFYARGRGTTEGTGENFAHIDPMRLTRKGVDRVLRFALNLAEQRKAQGRPGRVTSVDKANVFAGMAFWRQRFEALAAEHPTLSCDSAYVDAMALNLVLKPWVYDVLVTENMFGDILSDQIAALVGGMGMAPSADIGDDHALFQPAHGTAPDIAGQGKANPSAMLLSAALMLEWLADRHADAALADGARAIEKALASAFAEGAVKPIEFGGSSGTQAITQAVLERL